MEGIGRHTPPPAWEVRKGVVCRSHWAWAGWAGGGWGWRGGWALPTQHTLARMAKGESTILSSESSWARVARRRASSSSGALAWASRISSTSDLKRA